MITMNQKSRGQPQFMPEKHFNAILEYAEVRRKSAPAHPTNPIHVPKSTGNIIIPIGKDMTWIDGFNETRSQGGMPSNVLHDDYLIYSDKWKQLKEQDYYVTWAREVAAYPEADGVFKSGKDLVDENWILPWEYISKLNDVVEFVGEKGRAIFIEPLDVQTDGNRVIIIPDLQSTIILSNFLQKFDWGKVDKLTRMPMEVTDQELNELPKNEKRYILRTYGAGLRPLARLYSTDFDVNRRFVIADWMSALRFGVARVADKEE